MKKIINAPDAVVDEMCHGIATAYPHKLTVDPKYRLVCRKNMNKNKVTLISGGGSGHEPAHAGYVGTGMLDVAVCGDVFASPSTIQVYKGIQAAASEKGTLLIIKNYSGDKMNFEAAAEMAEDDDLVVDTVFVNDDVAVQDSLYTVGRRGVAGTVFVHKIAGAAAEQGLDLPEVKRLAQKASDNVRSLGFALTSCTVPAKGTPTFELDETEIEYGVGIHGEPGIERKELLPSADLVKNMLDRILDDFGSKPAEIALMVNGFGATPDMELYVMQSDASKYLEEKSISVYKSFVGNFMTSIDMAGASLSVFVLDDELKALLDAPVDVFGLNMF